MDESTHNEVPKPETKGYSSWLSIPEIFEDHSKNIESFVHCYLIFHGTAGKCHRCFARGSCLELNAEIS
ncbi:hypothetical protein ES703_79848 [subsurface metagenome]